MKLFNRGIVIEKEDIKVPEISKCLFNQEETENSNTTAHVLRKDE